MSSTRGVSEYYAFRLIPVMGSLVDGFRQSVIVLSWMGFAVGVLAGLGWPGRSMAPRWLSGDAQTSSDSKNLAALAVVLGLRRGHPLDLIARTDGPRGSRPALMAPTILRAPRTRG